jgi:hypothetical protein
MWTETSSALLFSSNSAGCTSCGSFNVRARNATCWITNQLVFLYSAFFLAVMGFQGESMLVRASDLVLMFVTVFVKNETASIHTSLCLVR